MEPDNGQTDHAANLVVDEHGQLAADVPCLSCGYNLRGLAVDATCPECGASVRWSVEEGLSWADPVWLGRLRSGAGWFLLGSVSGAVRPMIFGLVPPLTASQVTWSTAATLWAIVSSGASLWGVWQLTEPEPGRDEPLGASPRRVARWLIMPTETLLIFTPSLFAIVGSVANWLRHGAGLVGLVGLAFLLGHLASLAPRAGHPNLATEATLLKWGFLAFAVVMLGGVLARSLASMAGSGQGSQFSAGCLLSVIGLVLIVWNWILLWRYWRRFRDTAPWRSVP